MAATVEEVWFEVTSLFYFREKIIEQYFAILLRLTVLWISTVNLDFANLTRHFQRWLSVSENKCGSSNLSDYIAGLKIARLRKNLPTVAAIIVSSTKITCVKVKNSLAPEHVCNMFFQQDRHYNLRSDFPVPRLQAFRKGVRALNVLGLLNGTCGYCACSS